MGWVTLTLRKTELKRSHTDYQNELLQISRRKRQMARQYAYEQLQVRNEQSTVTRGMYDDYKSQRDALSQQLSGASSTGLNTYQYTTDANGNRTYDQQAVADAGTNGGTVNTENTTEKTYIQNQIDALYADYQFEVNDTKNDYEQQLEALEQEANDTETDLDQQQVQIEAQLEAISAEIEAVGEAISSQIQASTIKLA